ncbi:MAG: bifunctional metallophosphatase/5'-nucleotidase [Ruminococcus sp.]|nr:bifunctional metallophosphatase/5'-nucleotidase [Ruminococcus sp.]
MRFYTRLAVKRLMTLAMAVMLLVSVCLGTGAAGATADAVSGDADEKLVTVLFTHDLHSHFLPSSAEDGGEFGGYARLMTIINEQRAKYPDAILVDGGDFSMGSLFQTCFATDALELRLMGQMGYDATTFGNHEFDYLPEGLASMLNAAVDSGDTLPAILDANYLPAEKGQEGYNADMWNALENYGVSDYMLLERGGVYFALFGITGYDSDKCAPNSGMILESPAQVSQQIVDEAVAECKELYGAEPVVVCLSHSGTEDGKGEDYDLASSVEGVDLIVSAHTHTTLNEAIKVGDTAIVSAGEYGKYLGVVKLSFDGESAQLADYELIAVDETVQEDPMLAQKIQQFKQSVDENYLAPYGFSFDEVLLDNTVKFESLDEVKATQHESTLGNLFSDAYKTAAQKALDEEVDIALTATGVIRETMPLGQVTVSDVFNAASLGVGTEGELVKVYVTGKDLKNVFEVDASVQPLMSTAQLFISGARYSFNTNRMIFNKVDSCTLLRDDGSTQEIEDDKLYSVVTGMYVGQMLGAVEEKSFGLLTVTPRDAQGNPIEAKDFVNYVIRDEQGNPVKEWYAISSYLKAMDGEMDSRYENPDGRKLVYKSLSPASLVRNANVFTYAVMAAVLLLIGAVVLIVTLSVRKARKKKAK